MQLNQEFMEKLGTQIIRDLVSKGCSRWHIMKEVRRIENRPNLSYNTVTDWYIGKYCDESHEKTLQQIRYEYCMSKGISPFKA